MRLRPALIVAAVVLAGSGGAISLSSATPTLELLGVSGGAVVRGQIAVGAEARGDIEEVALSVSTDQGISWDRLEPMARVDDRWSVPWDTLEADDGPAVVRAVALDRGGTEVLSEEASIEVRNPPVVSLSVTPALVSPNADGLRDESRVEVQVSEAASVSVRVLRDAAVLGEVFTQELPAPGTVSFDWDGRTGEGEATADGEYRIEASATDHGDLEGIVSAEITVDAHGPDVDVLRTAPEPVTTERSMTFTIENRDPERQHLSLEIVGPLGTVTQVALGGRGPGQTEIPWRARQADGTSLPSGRYRPFLVAADDAGNVTRASGPPFRVLRPTKPHVFNRLAAAGPRVALTFDDCFNSVAWGQILDGLAARDVKASFFCLGTEVRRYPDLAKRTVAEGHAIGAHGWDHEELKAESVRATTRRLRADEKAWWDVTKATTAPYFRPPYGSYDANTLRGAGLTAHTRVIMWDVDPVDWIHRPVGEVVARATGPAQEGSIVVMHTEPPTAASVPAIVDALRAKGLEPVSLPVLFRAAGLR